MSPLPIESTEFPLLYPFTETRDFLDIRVGITTLREKSEEQLKSLVKKLKHPWNIFELNDECIRADFKVITKGRVSDAIPESVQVMKSTNIFIEPGATLTHCMLN